MKRLFLFFVFCISFTFLGCDNSPSLSGESLEILRKAEAGDMDAQYNMGQMYGEGKGVPKNDDEAIKWYKLAAEQGHLEAQRILGQKFDLSAVANKGLSSVVSEDFAADETSDLKEAFKWYHKAAEQGDASAQVKLGGMYKRGRGVPQDYKKAVIWYRKAADQGYNLGQIYLGELYADGKGVIEDDKEAVKWYCKAIEKGDALSLLAMDLLWKKYADGKGLIEDDTEAVKWLRISAEHGNVFAQTLLGVMYADGEGVTKDDAESVRWYTKAAKQGYAEAQYNLGAIYDNRRDYKESVRWYSKAAEQGHADAQFNCAIMYADGQGVIENYVEAYKWSLIAGMNGKDVVQIKNWLKVRMTPEQITEAQKQAKAFVIENEASTEN